MNIIFGQDEAEKLGDSYTVLQLDTIRIGVNGPEVPAFCIIENLPIMDFPLLPGMKSLHESLISHYAKKDWQFCLNAIEQLQGFWGKELDSFYNNMHERIIQYQQQDPGENWTPVIQK
jgi:hypothetical protein